MVMREDWVKEMSARGTGRGDFAVGMGDDVL